ncbi:hypothetical protein [Haloarcula salinisoli]|uniref:hypothetical protein n=1 Tax=Haloarcula salinisoli TaxID=2487746 RepID=UPI0039A44314
MTQSSSCPRGWPTSTAATAASSLTASIWTCSSRWTVTPPARKSAGRPTSASSSFRTRPNAR